MAVIQSIRNNLGSLFFRIVVGAIVVTFALFFGWGTVFSNSDANTVASVNGEKIDLYDLDLEMANVQSILRQRSEDPDYSFDEGTLKSLALNSLITDSVILSFIKKEGIQVSNKSAYKLLSKNEIFQESGKFSIDRVNTFARQNGFLPGKYIESITEDIAINYWRLGIGASSFITPKEIDQLLKMFNQTRDITFIKLNYSNTKESIKLTNNEVENFYNNNSALFETPEKAKIKFIEISLNELKENKNFSEEEIKLEYDSYLSSYDTTPRRSASHLMLDISSQKNKSEAFLLIDEIKKKLQQGNKFEDLVLEYSEDEGTKNIGGALGVSDGTSFPQEFEIVLKELKEGQISEPVILENSLHLLKLTNVQTPVPESFNSKRGEIEENLIEQLANQEYFDLLELASDLVFSIDSLESLAQKLNAVVRTQDFFSRSQAQGIFENEIVLNSIFNNSSLKEGNISDLIEVDDQTSIILKIEDFQEVETEDFIKVSDIAKNLLTDSLTREKLNSQKSDILRRLEGGSSLDEVSKENSLRVQEYKSLTRDSSLFSQRVLETIFYEPKSNMKKSFTNYSLPNGDELIFRLDKVTEQDKEFPTIERDSLKDLLENERSQSELINLHTNMKEIASIEIN